MTIPYRVHDSGIVYKAKEGRHVRLRLALQKISTCSLTHDVSSLEDDNIKCVHHVHVFKETFK